LERGGGAAYLVMSLVHGAHHYGRNHYGYQTIFNRHHRGSVGKEPANGFHPGSMGDEKLKTP
jgi:hypothetical protein